MAIKEKHLPTKCPFVTNEYIGPELDYRKSAFAVEEVKRMTAHPIGGNQHKYSDLILRYDPDWTPEKMIYSKVTIET